MTKTSALPVNHVAFWGQNTLQVFSRGESGWQCHNQFERIGAQPVHVAIPAKLFSRRHFPKPFHTLSRLKKIVPGFLQDNWLLREQPPYQPLLSVNSTQQNHFLSYTLPRGQLTQLMQTAAKRLPGSVYGIPEQLGLAAYVPAGEGGIVLARQEDTVLAAVFDDHHHLLDFTSETAELWPQRQALVLGNWQSMFANARLYAAGNDMPWPEEALRVTLKTDAAQQYPAAYGLAQLLENSRTQTGYTLFTAPSRQWLAARVKPGVWALAGLLVLMMAYAGFLAWQSTQLTARTAQASQQIQQAFKQVLPNTPMLDPVVQLQRRFNALTLQLGGTVAQSNVLANLSLVQQALQQAEVPIGLDTLEADDNRLRLRGTVATLGQVDAVQQAVQRVLAGWQSKLNQARLEEGSVVFDVEFSQ